MIRAVLHLFSLLVISCSCGFLLLSTYQTDVPIFIERGDVNIFPIRGHQHQMIILSRHNNWLRWSISRDNLCLFDCDWTEQPSCGQPASTATTRPSAPVSSNYEALLEQFVCWGREKWQTPAWNRRNSAMYVCRINTKRHSSTPFRMIHLIRKGSIFSLRCDNTLPVC